MKNIVLSYITSVGLGGYFYFYLFFFFELALGFIHIAFVNGFLLSPLAPPVVCREFCFQQVHSSYQSVVMLTFHVQQ